MTGAPTQTLASGLSRGSSPQARCWLRPRRGRGGRRVTRFLLGRLPASSTQQPWSRGRTYREAAGAPLGPSAGRRGGEAVLGGRVERLSDVPTPSGAQTPPPRVPWAPGATSPVALLLTFTWNLFIQQTFVERPPRQALSRALGK